MAPANTLETPESNFGGSLVAAFGDSGGLLAVATTMTATAIAAAIIVCRPASHRLLDEFHVLWLRAFRPGRIRTLHRRDAMAVLVSHQQAIVADHQTPARVRVPSVVGLPKPDRQRRQHLSPA